MKNTLTFIRLPLILVLWLWIPVQVDASDFAFRRYTTDHGLSNDQITCIFKDRQGFMWFGTVNGLNRFDGIQFKIFKRSVGALPGNYIIDINQSPDGWMWIATHRGICRFDPLTETFEQIPLPNQTDERGDNDFVSGIVFDKQGFGWFATADNLYRINLQTMHLTTYSGASQDVNPLLMYLFADSQGQLWVMRAGALYQFDPGKKQYTYIFGQDSQHRDSPVHVISLYEDSQKRVWASTYEKGLFRYDHLQNCFVDEPDGGFVINAMVEDWLPDGQSFFWMGKGDEQVATYQPDKQIYTAYSNDPRDPLSHNGGIVVDLFRDPQTGIVWMATDRGIQKADLLEIKFKRKIFPVQQEINPKSLVTAIRQDRHDPATYWIGLNGSGLVQWNREKNTFHLISEKQGLSGKNVYDLRQDTKGNLWIAVNNRLDFWEVSLNKWHHYTDFLVSKNTFQAVTTVYQDKQNRIWVGTSEDGVFKLDPQTNKLLPWSLGEVLSLGNPLRVHKFEEDTRQRIWVSTNRGMFRIDPARQQTEKITLHPLNQHIQPSDRLQSTLKIDSKGNLWSSGIGFLAKADLNGQVIQTYTQENGLQADHIFSIEEDNAGMLWMATDNFLHRLDPQSGEFTYFRKENGLYANTIDTWINKDASGELFLGFTNAFNHFVPEQVMYNRLQQPLVITEIKIDNKKHWPGNSPSVSIHPSENTFSIAFALLNYSLPEKNQYAFMLEGFDKNWTMTENRHATYTNLSPGNYTFKVKAANNDGVWNEQGITLPIKVIPAFYQTWWFFLLIAALAVGIISIIFRYREQNRLRLEGIRNRIATDLHDDMGSTLSSIRIFSDVVQKQIAPVQPEAVPILQRISSSATTLSESMQDIIWTIQSRHDSLDDVVTRMREFGLKMAEARGVEFKMQISDKFQTTRLDVEQRRNVYLIFKETINNAIKYAECTQISVVLEVSGRNLYLQITDNGKGFDLATIRQGNGLQNLQKRAHEIGGKLSIQSAPGAGTSIELQVRLTS